MVLLRLRVRYHLELGLECTTSVKTRTFEILYRVRRFFLQQYILCLPFAQLLRATLLLDEIAYFEKLCQILER